MTTTKPAELTPERIVEILARNAARANWEAPVEEPVVLSEEEAALVNAACGDITDLLAEVDRLRAEREQWQRATGCVSHEVISAALGRIGASLGRAPTEGIPDAIARLQRERDDGRVRQAAMLRKIRLLEAKEHEYRLSVLGELEPDLAEPIKAIVERLRAERDEAATARLDAALAAKELDAARWQTRAAAWKSLALAHVDACRSPTRSPKWCAAVDRMDVAICSLRALGIDPDATEDV